MGSEPASKQCKYWAVGLEVQLRDNLPSPKTGNTFMTPIVEGTYSKAGFYLSSI